MDTEFKLSRLTIILHWIIAITMICLIVAGFCMVYKKVFWLYDYHKSIGVMIFLVALLRVVWRYKNGWPTPLSQLDKLQQTLAKTIHWLILAATVIMPISGMFNSGFSGHGFGIFGFEIVPANRLDDNFVPYNHLLARLGHVSHKFFGFALVAAIFIHIAGAMKHHLINKDGTLLRILGKNLKT